MLSRPPPLLPFDIPGAEQLDWDTVTEELTWHGPVRQTFSCRSDQLHRIEIFIETHARPNNSHLWLKLFEGALSRENSGPIRVVGPIATGDFLACGWFAFEFEPIRGSKGKQYTAVLEAPDGLMGDSISCRQSSLCGEGLSAGNRFLSGSLLFRAVCLRSSSLYENFKLFRHNSSRHGTRVKHHPLMARLEISRPCNLHCTMCYRGISPFDPARESPAFLSLESLRSIDSALPTLLWAIAFGLGEPFLNPDYLALLRHTRMRAPLAHIFASTNGTRLEQATIDAILGENLLSEVQISIDGADKSTFESIRKKARYETVLGALHRVLAAREKRQECKIEVKVEMLVMRQTASQIYDYVRQMAALGVDRVVLDSPKGELFESIRVETAEEISRVYDQVARSHAFLRGRGTILTGPLLEELQVWSHHSRGMVPEWGLDPCASLRRVSEAPEPACAVPWESINLSSDGSLRVCCNSDRCVSKAGVERASVSWENGSVYRRLRTELLERTFHSDCGRCLSGNAGSPSLITPPTYLSACAVDRGESGAMAGLIGRFVDVCAHRRAEAAILEVDEAGSEFSWDLKVRRISGWLDCQSQKNEGIHLAIAVRGRIVALASMSNTSAGFGRWSAVMPRGSTTFGQSGIEVFRIVMSDQAVSLVPLACRPGKLPRNLRRPPVTPHSPAACGAYGFIDEVAIKGGFLSIRGWACDAETGDPSSRIIALCNQRVVQMVRPWMARPDVAKIFGKGDSAYGFTLEVPCRLLMGGRLRSLAVLSVGNGRISQPLVWGPGLLERSAQLLDKGKEHSAYVVI